MYKDQELSTLLCLAPIRRIYSICLKSMFRKTASCQHVTNGAWEHLDLDQFCPMSPWTLDYWTHMRGFGHQYGSNTLLGGIVSHIWPLKIFYIYVAS